MVHSAWLRAIGRVCASAIRCFQLVHEAHPFSRNLSDEDFAKAVREMRRGRGCGCTPREQHVRRMMAELRRDGIRVEAMQMRETEFKDRECGTRWAVAKMLFEQLVLEAEAMARLEAGWEAESKQLDAQSSAMFATLQI